MMLETYNLFREFPSLYECQSKIIGFCEDGIYLDQTIFYAESGGQEADHGLIHCSKASFRVVDVQYEKHDSKKWRTKHILHEEDRRNLHLIAIDERVTLKIEAHRRVKLTAYHTASHIMYLAIESIRPDLISNIIGCHIKEDGARFDFSTHQKLSPFEISEITKLSNDLIDQALPITLSNHGDDPNQFYWSCAQRQIPCGGTHLDNTSKINYLQIKRKGIGAAKERIICSANGEILNLRSS